MGDSKKDQKKHKEKDKKRKNRSSIVEYEQEQSKAPRFENEQEQELKDCDSLQFVAPWTNLQLILSLQNKQIDTQRYITRVCARACFC